ncbi:MAG TPA: metal ABC transporter permease [Clostridiaceae bacterium]|nr:metal ABC transporter permease [Clostridiaceae bacterium]
MFDLLQEMFSYPFMLRAFLVGTPIALCASLLGVSLVLKRYAMIGDGLSHVGFGALALAAALNASPLTVSIPIVVVAAFLLLRLSENSKIKGDAAISLISTGSLAIGVMVISLSSGMNTDVSNYLFGSILSMSQNDVLISFGLSIIVIVIFVLFYNRIFAVTFDENFAKATGTNIRAFNMIIAFLTALVIVVGMRLMGALLITSLIVFPALTAMRLAKRFFTVTLNSALVSIICLWSGLILSYKYSTPTGASIVICNIMAFVIYSIIQKIRDTIIREK